jgi:hypothetical protein
MDDANLIRNARRLCRYQSQGREDPAAHPWVAESVGELEVPDTGVPGTKDPTSSIALQRSCALSPLGRIPPYRTGSSWIWRVDTPR